jgi:Phytanoyl-CoA dioxygenase (PhyH)
LIFHGDLLVFKRVPALLEAASLVDEMIPKAPGEDEIEDAKSRFTEDPRIDRLMRSALDQVGVATDLTYWDAPRLRIVPPGAERRVGTIGFHRDTWGSNVLAQTNWWLPLRPLTGERTIAFYPEYWSKPIANTSADWDLAEIRERRRAGEPIDDLPIVPEPSEPVSTEAELRMVVEPGDLLCFSGAHLHASVPNTSAEARVSVELRTVHSDDLEGGRGAPNLDGRAPVTPYYWFRSMLDGEPLNGDDAQVWTPGTTT